MVIAKAGIILFAITKAGIIFLSQNVESFVGLRCDVKSVEKGRGCRRARVKWNFQRIVINLRDKTRQTGSVIWQTCSGGLHDKLK